MDAGGVKKKQAFQRTLPFAPRVFCGKLSLSCDKGAALRASQEARYGLPNIWGIEKRSEEG